MLFIDVHVPDAVLLPEKITDLQGHLTKIGAHWFRMKPAFFDAAEGSPRSVDAVRSCTSDARLKPTQPHQKNRFDNAAAEARGLTFIAEQHCGYVATDLGTSGHTWSCAVRFQTGGDDPRTLFTLNSDSVDNYVFLQQKAGQTTLKDQRSTLELTVNSVGPDSGSRLIVAGMSGDRLWLRVHDGPVEATTVKAGVDLAMPHNLFLGCRSNKNGLQKTLGAFALRDAFFWPDRNILEPEHAETLEALDLPDLWEV